MSLPDRGALQAPPAPRTIPWANGLGVSRELWLSPGPAVWRIATTWIERDCAFSHMQGKRRLIVLLRGNGFRLGFGAHGAAELVEPGASASFLGDWTTGCNLVDGRVEVLNLIVDESTPVPRVERLGRGVTQLHEHARAIFCVSGEGAVAAGGSSFDLLPGTLLMAHGSAPTQVSVTSPDAELHLLQLVVDESSR